MNRNRIGNVRICLILLFTLAADRGTSADDREVIPDDKCVLELNLPDKATVTIDGRYRGFGRRFTYLGVKCDRWIEKKLQIEFAGGKSEERTILLRGGEHIRLARQDPAIKMPEVVPQTGFIGESHVGPCSPDGKHVFGASGRFFNIRAASLWDTRTGRKVRAFYPDPPSTSIPLGFTPDSTRVLTAEMHFVGEDEIRVDRLLLWDKTSGERLWRLSFPSELSPVCVPSFSRDGKRLALLLRDRILVVNIQTGHTVATLAKEETGSVRAVGLSPSGDEVAIGSSDGTVVFWDIATARAVRTIEIDSVGSFSIEYAATGPFAVVNDDSVTLWDIKASRKLGEFEGAVQPFGGSLSPCGRRFLTVSDRQAILWDTETGKRLGTLQMKNRSIDAAQFCCNGAQIVAMTGRTKEPAIAIWQTETQQKLRTMSWRADEPTGLVSFAVMKSGRLLVMGCASEEKCVPVLWDAADGRLVGPLDGITGPPLDLSPDGRQILTYADYETVALYDIASRKRLGTFKHGGFHWLPPASFSPAGDRIVTITGDGATLWDVATGRKIDVVSPARLRVRCATFTRDGLGIAVGGYDRAADFHSESIGYGASGRLVLCHAETGRELHTYAGRWEPVTSVSYSPDGGSILIGMGMDIEASTDPRLIVLDAASGAEIRVFRGYSYGTLCADGRHVLAKPAVPLVGDTAFLLDIATGFHVAQLTVLNGGKDWLVGRPEGLFDGSFVGRQKVCFRIGGGLNVVPVDRLFHACYRPGLLAEVWRGERPLPDVEIGEKLPPALKIVSPKSGTIDERMVTVEAEAVDQGGGVGDLSLYQNGSRVLAPGTMRRDGDVVRRTFEVSLVEGPNHLRVKAASADGSWESEPAEVVLTYEKPLPTQLHVLVVGINHYADANLNLRFATNDARTLADLFRRRGDDLYSQVRVTELLDHEATREGIVESLKQLAARTRPEDTLVVFLSGHGRMVGQRYYFVPYELRKQGALLDDDLRKQGLPADEISDYLGSAHAVKRILILDTCASGGALGPAVKTRSGFALRGAVERLSRTHGIYTIAAAAATEEALEPAELGHGVLSYALLAGLKAVDRGPLDGVYVQPSSPERVVDVMEWITYAAGHVPRLTERLYGTSQDVQYSIRGQSFPILPLDD